MEGEDGGADGGVGGGVVGDCGGAVGGWGLREKGSCALIWTQDG